ncbi:hypothetical protein Dimus_019308 [Dionaea muscipula]
MAATTTTSLDEETSKKVIRQVEFYFSDSNLPRDKFLKQTISESEDGLVSLALICTFSRMRGHLGLGEVKPEDISEDTVKPVANTLRTSSFLKVSEDGKKVGRAIELAKPEELIQQLDNRTVAASPLPYDVKHENVESFFAQFAKVNSVRLPTHVYAKKVFCGTALIEFAEEEDAQKILKQSLVYDGAELELRPKKDFDEERKKQTRGVDNTHSGSDCRSSDEADYTKGLVLSFLLKRKESGTKQNDSIKVESDASKTDGTECEEIVPQGSDKVTENDKGLDEVAEEDIKPKINGESGHESDGKEAKDDEKSSEVADDKDGGKAAHEQKPGHEKDIKQNINGESGHESDGKQAKDDEKSSEVADDKDGGKAAHEQKPTAAEYKNNADVVLREDLKAVFEKFGTVKFVDFKMGAESGYIRFEVPEASQKARAVAVLSEEGGLIVKNYIASLEPVTGEAEKEYWKFRDHTKDNKGRGGKQQRGGKRGWSRGKDSAAGRPNKFQKFGRNKS